MNTGKIHFYIRLLSYDEAVSVTDKMEVLGGNGNITGGGISLTGTQNQWDEILTFMEENCNSFELSKSSPTEVTKNIVSDLKRKGEIK